MRGILRLRREPAGDDLDRAVIEFAQQRRLPAVPHLRTDGANIGHGQDQQQLQSLRRLHPLDKAGDRLRIADVELEGGVAHQQMPAHQPGDGLGLLGRKPEPRAELQRDLFAEHRMIAAAALCDVVQQRREIESTARNDRRHQLGGERKLLLQLARVSILCRMPIANSVCSSTV